MSTEGQQALDLLRRIAEALERAHPPEPRGLMDRAKIVVAKPEKSAHNGKHDELRPKTTLTTPRTLGQPGSAGP